MEALKSIIKVVTVIGLMLASFLTGLTVGEYKAQEILYRVEHLEQRIGAIDVIEKGKTSGFAKAMINR